MLVSIYLGGVSIAVAVVATIAIAMATPKIIKPILGLPFAFTLKLILSVLVIFIIAAATILMYLTVIVMVISLF